jgi:hypothetical protein
LISYALSVVGILVVTLIPAYLALYLVSNLKPIKTRYIAAAGIGLTFWWFFDTMGDAAALDSNQAIYPFSAFGGLSHFSLIVTFAAGIAALAIFDHFAVPNPDATSAEIQSGASARSMSKYAKSLILIPIGVAAVMGIHGLGEGWDFASAAAAVPTSSIVDAFGGVNAIISYPLHKFFEGAIIAAVYTAYVARSNSPKATWHIPVLGLLLGFTSVIGASIGYTVSFDTTYFYAFGVTAAFYAMLRLVEAVNLRFKVGENAPTFLGWKIFLAIGIGFFLLYTAALFH